MSELNELLDELEALSKAMPASEEKDDAKIQAAAEEGKDAHDEPDGDEDGGEAGDADGDEPGAEDEAEEDDEDEEDEDERLGKSFSATLDDGSSIRAYDGTDLIKSLMAASEAQKADLLKAVGATTAAVREMQKLIKAQSAELQTLRADLSRIGGEGRGRKTLLNVHEKPAVTAPPAESGVSGRELMTKAMTAFKAGRLSGTEVATLEAYLGRGMQPPGYLLEKM